MAQPPQPQHRPSFTSPTTSFSPNYPQQNGRPQFSPQSPGGPVSFSSPSPQPQFSPTYSGQAPPLKKARISPEGPTSIQPPVYTPQAGSHVNGQMNGLPLSNASRSGSMPPPQAPGLKKEERDNDSSILRDVQTNGGVQPVFSPTGNSLQPQTMSGSLQKPPSTIHSMSQPAAPTLEGRATTQMPTATPEERARREQERKDWEESRHAQHELWNSFLFGAALNDRLKLASAKSNLLEPQAGVLVNTQKNQPPPRVRVNGLEGASVVINGGQSILDTKDKADRLNELVKLLSLSAKARLTGLIQTAAQLAVERRQHSQGRIPEEWTDIAAPVKHHDGEAENVSSPTPTAGTKRTHAEANQESSSRRTHPAATAFRKATNRAAAAEKARQTKRRKRNEVSSAQEQEAVEKAEAEAVAAALEADRKTTKKERKIEQSRVSEQQQHASTNEAARLALSTASNILGRSKNKKSYAWMMGGANTPNRPVSAAATPNRTQSAANVPQSRSEAVRGAQLGDFDELSEGGIQARDVLAVLETDGRAAKSYVKGSSIVDEPSATTNN